MIITRLFAPVALLAAIVPVSTLHGEITAVGRSWHGLDIAGPNELGRYALRVSIADLDPATVDGWAVMTRRVAMGTALLCDAAAPQPLAGYYYREQRDCRAESAAIAGEQMARARDQARSGGRVAWLEVMR